MTTLRLISAPKDIGDGVGFILRTISDNLPVFTADKKLRDRYSNKLKWKIGVSLCSGCGVKCIYCFTNKYSHFRPLCVEEIIEQVELVISQPGNSMSEYDEVKISFKQMGDPLMNSQNTCLAIRQLHKGFPNIGYVVSTSGARCNKEFFSELQAIQDSGIKIRFQFSCHTTSDKERRILSPKISMMTFAEIAEIVNNWNGGAITLNFVMMSGFEYDVIKIQELFNQDKMFIKINYLDDNKYLQKYGLRNIEKGVLDHFIDALNKGGFKYAFRNHF